MRIVLTGPDGQIGWELRRALAGFGDLICAGRDAIDLLEIGSIRTALHALRPDLIINAGAYTSVDRAEDEPDVAQAVNAEAPAVIAEAACHLGAAMIHYSTDYIFDGQSKTPYAPADPANPINVYGRTKLAGERGIANEGARALVLRTSWVYSWRRHNFLRSILAKASEQSSISVVRDQLGCPTWSRIIADQTAQLIRSDLGQDEDGKWGFGGREGTYHICCSGISSWFEFAQAIVEHAGLKDSLDLRAIDSEDYPQQATRPRYSALDCSKAEETFGLTMPAWRDALAEAFQESDVAGRITSKEMRKGA